MIAKTFKGGRTAGGAKATFLYLLNERVHEGTSKMIRGDATITQSLIDIASKKQAWSWSSGVLSFEESILEDAILQSIMDDFERTFFAGLQRDNYNISWIMHTDKGRTELHYIAPRLELSTGLSFNPYFVERDFAKKDLFQEYINLKYGFTSYKDSRELTPRPPKWRDDAKKTDIRKSFDDALLPLIQEGILSSREELIYQLQEWGFELTREGKEYIAVVGEDGKTHRLKGLIYGEDFTSWEAVETKAERDGRTVANGVPRELTAVRAELDRIVEQQSHTHREKYRRKSKSKDEPISQSQSQSIQADDERARTRDTGGDETVEKTTNVSSPYHPCIWLDIGYANYKIPLIAPVPTPTKKEEGNSTDDTVRTEAIGRIRKLRERTAERAGAYGSVIERVRKKHREYEQQFDQKLSREIDGAYTKREQRKRELDSILEDTTTPTAADYNVIEKSTAEQRLGGSARTNIVKIFQQFGDKFDYLKQSISRATRTSTERLISKAKDKARQELNKFKTNINLAEFSSTFGYTRDKITSSTNAPVMVHEDGDKIIIAKDKSDSHYVYFNPQNDRDKGTIIDFMRNRTNETLRDIKKRCRAWLHNPQPKESIIVAPSTKDARSVMRIWDSIDTNPICIDKKWGLKKLDGLIKSPHVKFGKDGYFYFSMNDVNGLCGIEKWKEGEPKHIIKGSVKGVFTYGNIKDAEQIVIFTSPVAMQSYLELNHLVNTFCICTMGSIGESTEESLEAIFEQSTSPIVIAVDNDEDGDKIANKIKEIVMKLDGDLEGVREDRPKQRGQDWNDVIVAKDEEIRVDAPTRGMIL